MILSKCINCGKQLEPRQFTTVQMYCSERCGIEFRKRKDKINKLAEQAGIQFDCAQCGRRVVVTDSRDKRTRFCCKECEKKYWKHPHYENESTRINFRSFDEYARYEVRTNE